MSSHLIVQTTTGHWYIISTLFNRTDTQVIHIERYTGQLVYNPFPHDGLFASPKEAIKSIAERHGANTKFRTVIKCHAIVGFQIICRTCNICVVTKNELELVLPPRHKVYRVKEMKWISISLAYPFLQSNQEEKHLEKLKTFPLADLHYYCESYDLTRTYPSKHAPHDYDEEFVWNHQLALPFHKLGLKEWTIVLLQGVAVGKVIKEQGKSIFISLFCKRGSWNPGTRYNSRGMNDKLAPGNEYEVEQLCWITEEDKTIKYSNAIWRRGTVPIHWRSELTNAVTDANIIVSNNPFKNIELYYQRVVDKYGSLPIVCLDLLRGKNVHQEEDNLSQKYGESLSILKTKMNIDIQHMRFDWHHQYKIEGLGPAAEQLWSLVGEKLKQFGVTTGVLKPGSGTQILDHQVHQRQTGIFRVNCADSLDRTNLCCFFNGVHIVAEQLRSLGVNILGNDKGPWETLNFSLEEVNQKYPSLLLLKYAEIFIQCGDICATLYTNTEAMHTKAMREYAQHLPAARSNAQLLVERRYQNMFNDQVRQTQYEMFLGINWEKYFPSHIKHLQQGETHYISHKPSYIVRRLPSLFQDLQLSYEDVLLSKTSNHIWICPENESSITVDISLPFYCRVTEIALAIRHGDSWETSPSFMDVLVGENFDNAILAFQHLQIPRCRDQTRLLFTLPRHVSGNQTRNSLYDFNGNMPRPRMRCVRLVFYGIPKGYSMTLGQIQIFGILSQSEKTSLQFFRELLQISTSQNLQQAIVSLEERDELNQRKEENGDIESDSTESDSEKESDSETENETDKVIEEDTIQDNIPISSSIETTIDTELISSINSEQNLFVYSENMSLTTFINAILNNAPISWTDENLKERDIYKSLVNQIASLRLTFLHVLELELARLHLKLLPTERDNILAEMNQKISRFNPNLFVYYRDLKLKKAEHKKLKSSNCNKCSTSIKLRKYTCHYCWHSFCKKCIEKTKIPIIEFLWKSNQQVCLDCYSLINRQKRLLLEIENRLQIPENQPSRDLTFENIFTDLYPVVSSKNRKFDTDVEESFVSEFPLANIMDSVDTDPLSAPIESILFPIGILPDKYWFSTTNVNNVTIKIILPITCILTKAILVVDPKGYTKDDVPTFKFTSYDRIPNSIDQGEWSLFDISQNSQDKQDGSLIIQPLKELEYTFSNKSYSRILEISVQFSNKVSNEVKRVIHLGRIMLYGKPTSSKMTASPFVTEADGNKYMDVLSKKSNTIRSHIKSETKISKSTQSIDLVKPVSIPVGGFQITVKHDSRFGILSQVKDIRVFILRQNEKKELESQELVGHFVIPKCDDGTSLVYDFKTNYENVAMIRFQFLSTYSAPKMSMVSIALYNWEVKNSISTL